jgi:hypothetical protein
VIFLVWVTTSANRKHGGAVLAFDNHWNRKPE